MSKEEREKQKMDAAYSKIEKRLEEIEGIMKKCEIYEIRKSIKADDEIIFEVSLKRA